MTRTALLVVVGCATACLADSPAERARETATKFRDGLLTYSFTDQPTLPWHDSTISFDVSAAWNKNGFGLDAVDSTWAAEPLIRTVGGNVQLVPPLFPEPPVYERRLVTETVTVTDWSLVHVPIATVGPFYNPIWEHWEVATLTQPTGTVTFDRLLEGPLSTQTITYTTAPPTWLQGDVRHAWLDGGWQPISSYVMLAADNSTGIGVPSMEHDGVSLPGFDLEAWAPIAAPPAHVPVPEPTHSGLILWLWGLRWVRSRKGR